MISCVISKRMVDKINFFHSKFRGKEWSGPAYFSAELDEGGYPKALKLVHFEVLDIATGGETEWGQPAFMSAMSKIIHELAPYEGPSPLIGGNIHSHHQMKAFFSNVDAAALEQHAVEEGFWVSIVVSTSEVPRCGAVSYKGKYGKTIIDYKMSVTDECNVPLDSFAEEIANAQRQNSERRKASKTILMPKKFFGSKTNPYSPYYIDGFDNE